MGIIDRIAAGAGRPGPVAARFERVLRERSDELANMPGIREQMAPIDVKLQAAIQKLEALGSEVKAAYEAVDCIQNEYAGVLSEELYLAGLNDGLDIAEWLADVSA